MSKEDQYSFDKELDQQGITEKSKLIKEIRSKINKNFSSDIVNTISSTINSKFMTLYKDKQNALNKNYNKYKFLKKFVVTSLKGAFKDKPINERRRLKQEIGSKTIKMAK